MWPTAQSTDENSTGLRFGSKRSNVGSITVNNFGNNRQPSPCLAIVCFASAQYKFAMPWQCIAARSVDDWQMSDAASEKRSSVVWPKRAKDQRVMVSSWA